MPRDVGFRSRDSLCRGPELATRAAPAALGRGASLILLVATASILAPLATPLSAEPGENRFPFVAGDRVEGLVPSPDEYFGVPLGSRFTPHHEILAYLRELASRSERIRVQEYGRTVEGRELVLCFIGEPAELARLEEIRALQGELADPRRREDGGLGPLEDLLPRLPAVLWLSYNVHGDEASASEAALWTAYQLVDGADEAAKRIRSGALVILDPCLNPDGRERYRSWYHQVAMAGGDPDPSAREHSQPWPGGRANHYLFDLNRDWAWHSQPETRARVREYLRWLPLVHVDFHEMSPESTYFFFPAAQPINPNVPESSLRWAETLGRANAAAFDRFGWLYYTGEAFDLFYPGYGDSWPSLLGAIGMTYEQAGGGAGVRYLRRDGDELTLAERLHHHHVAGMATLLGAVERKGELQLDFHAFRRGAIEEGRSGTITEFFFPPGQGERLDRLVSLLTEQGIEVRLLAAESVADGLVDFHGDEHPVVKLPAGTRTVSLDQPAGRLARALLEPRVPVTDAYFYDVSAWSLPMAMAVEGYTAAGRLDAFRVPIEPEPKPGHVEGEARYAYLLEWGGTRAARALQALHEAGIGARLVPERIAIGGRVYPPGAIVVPARGDEVHAAVREIAERCEVVFRGVSSGWTDEGIDLGSEKVTKLRPPRIAVACGDGVSSLSYGAIWSLFEQQLDVPFTAIDLDRLGRTDLDEFDVLVLPDGRGYRDAFDEKGSEHVRRFVRAGGTLVAIDGAAFAIGEEGAKLSTRKSQIDGEGEEKPDGGPYAGPGDAATAEGAAADESATRKKLADLEKESEERQVPGNIFRIDLDADHPLAFGQPARLFAFMEGTRTFALAGDGGDVAAFTEDPAASGFISEENIAKVRSRVYLAEESLGEGHIVLFAGDPNFRGFWHGLTGLFLNAVYLRAAY